MNGELLVSAVVLATKNEKKKDGLTNALNSPTPVGVDVECRRRTNLDIMEDEEGMCYRG